MLLLVGLIVVVASVLGGYVLAHGELWALWQPFELIIILGAAFGAFLIANSWHVIWNTFASLPKLVLGSGYDKEFYTDLMTLLERLFNKIKKDGVMAVENDIEAPEESEVFQRYPAVMQKVAVMEFICDTMRIVSSGNMKSHELESIMDEEIDTHLHSLEEPSHAVGEVADALPGFGIVAAVLGIVITMSMLDQGQEAIGRHVAAALVGTFLGIIFAYGFVGPVAKGMARLANQEIRAFYCVKASIMGMMAGLPPSLAIEFGRKTLPRDQRPSFQELEDRIRGE